jgi:serine/threonine-protein kinase
MARDFLPVVQKAMGEKFRIEEEIGSGGMAIVFRAVDLGRGSPVALKVLRPEVVATVHRERFLREIDRMRRLDHRNIVPVYEAGEAGPLLYLVMQLIEGGPEPRFLDIG